MKLQDALDETIPYLRNITINAELDFLPEIEVVLPTSWILIPNTHINIQIINEVNGVKFVKIIPSNKEFILDDMIAFLVKVINDNKKIEEEEEQFRKTIEDRKNKLKEEEELFKKSIEEKRNNLLQSSLKIEKEIKDKKPKKIKNSKSFPAKSQLIIDEYKDKDSLNKKPFTAMNVITYEECFDKEQYESEFKGKEGWTILS